MQLEVVYSNAHYRIHSAACRDAKKEAAKTDGPPRLYDTDSLQEIAECEWSDFIDEDPDYYTTERLLADFRDSCTILPCVKGLK